MDELTNNQLLDDMLLDFWIFKLRRVGHKRMTSEQLWRSWLEY